MGPRRSRLILPAVGAFGVVFALACSSVRAHAAACGDDSSPPCPAAQTVVPDVINTPVQGATVDVRGTGLALVESAALQPGGAALPILGRSDPSLTLRLPDHLAPGSYRIQLAIAGQTQGFSMTPFFQVGNGSAARGLPQFTFAPAPAQAQAPASASKAAPPTLFTPRSDTSFSWGSIIRLTIVVLATGAIGGGLVTVIYPAIRRWREVKLRDLTYAAMERRLADLWSSDEQRVGAMRKAPSPEREPSPTRRY